MGCFGFKIAFHARSSWYILKALTSLFGLCIELMCRTALHFIYLTCVYALLKNISLIRPRPSLLWVGTSDYPQVADTGERKTSVRLGGTPMLCTATV